MIYTFMTEIVIEIIMSMAIRNEIKMFFNKTFNSQSDFFGLTLYKFAS
jgi:hypothetical protein